MKNKLMPFRSLPVTLLLCGALQAASSLMADPIVNLTAPEGSEPLVLGKPVEVTIEVSEADVPITNVTVHADGQPVGQAVPGGASWQLTYVPISLAPLELRAEALDADGALWSSDLFTFDVLPTEAPEVSILSPVDGSRFLPGTNLPIQVLAADPDGLISRVDFFLNDNQVASVMVPPFRTEIQLPSIGTYVLEARARDDQGVERFSDEIILEAGPPDAGSPRIVMDFPLPLGDGDTVNDVSYASAMFLNATATDPDGSIETVNFYINGQKLGEAENRVGDVYSLFYDPNALGSYVISAEAIDDEGNVSWSVPLLLDVGPLERQLPEAQMIAPFEESIIGRVVGLFVEADGGLIPIDRVDFFANGVFLGSVDDPAVDNLYSLNWVPEEPGDYDLQARIVQIDPAGAVWDNWKITDPVPITISEPEGEEEAFVEIINPGDGASSVVLRPIFIQAEALDPLGSIEEIRYYVNGRQQDFVDTRFPYSFTYEPQSPGLFQFVAEMLTDRGLRVQSDPVAIKVVVTDKPSGEIILPNGDNPTAGSDVRLLVEGNDPDGFIEETELFVNGKPLRETFWRPENPGIYDLSALLTDNSGNEVEIKRTVTVGEPVGIPPRVTLSVTGSGNVTPGSRVVVRANVFDDDPEDMRVSFLLNGEFIGEDVEPPYSIIVDPEVAAPNGAYSLTALASDRDGNSRADNLAPLYISDFSVDQPSVEILNLSTGDEVTLGSRVPIRVDVSGGAAANLAHVVFYADGVEVGRLPGGEPTGKYTFDWIPDRLGWNQVSVATLLQTENFDHDDDIETPLIPVTPVNVSSPVSVFANEAIGVLPSISLDVMPSNANLAIGSKVMLYADAQDLGGEIERVQFFIDGVNVGTDTEAPFTYVLTTTRQGDFPINALATDSDGNVVTSTVINLNVASRVVTRTPSISLTVPSSGQEGSLLSLRASTAGFVNPPEGITFYANGESIGESEDVPYSLPWLVNLNGAVTFFSTATQTLFDGTRVTTVSQIEESLLSTNEVPVIEEFVASFPGESPEKPNPLGGEPITFTVRVQDSGPLRSVELLRDGEPVQESESAASPFEFTDTPPGLGIYEYSVVVTDRGGLQAQSGVVSISVVVGEAPLVSVTAPEADSEFRPGNPVQLRASAMDPDGLVREVSFLVDGLLVGEVLASAPYEVAFTPPAAGDYSIVARARDNSGNLSESDPVTFTVVPDNPPQFLNFSNDLTGNIARVNKEIVWTVDVDDDYGLVAVDLFRNGERVSTEVAIPLEISDTLTGVGRFRYFAEATDTAGNVTRSNVIEVTTTRGEPPAVSIQSPQSNSSINLSNTVTIRASASVGGIPAGTIESVSFFSNGVLLGQVERAPYILTGVNLFEGSNILTAVATSDTGLTSVSGEVLINGVDGTVPEILVFRSNSGGGQTLVGTPVEFDVEASDENGIQRIDLRLGGSTVSTVPGSPAQFVFTPEEAGLYSFTALATNADGLSAESEPLVISARYPDPVSRTDDFVYQSFLDLLFRTPTAEESTRFINRIGAGDLTRARFVRELIHPADGQAEGDYDPVRGALLANRLLLGEWPERDQLEADRGAVADSGLAALVASLMPDFEARYVQETGFPGVPERISPETEIEAYLRFLFSAKYGREPTLSQLALGKLHFLASGRDAFTASFLADVEIVVTANGYVTIGLGFQFPSEAPPSETFLREADAASLLINFLRVRPTEEEVTELAKKLFAAQVAGIVEDPRYAARFSSTFELLEHYPNGWKRSEWFGWFNTAEEPWVFHSELGWIAFEMVGRSEENFWYFDGGMGWVWTQSGMYPVLYREESSSWLFNPRFSFSGMDQRWFFDYGSGNWIRQ